MKANKVEGADLGLIAKLALSDSELWTTESLNWLSLYVHQHESTF